MGKLDYGQRAFWNHRDSVLHSFDFFFVVCLPSVRKTLGVGEGDHYAGYRARGVCRHVSGMRDPKG
jgi:hypothetical protein